MASVTPAAANHYRQIQRLQAIALRAARRTWRQVEVDRIKDSWARTSAQLVPVVSTTMASAALSGAFYGVNDMAERGTYVPPREFVNAGAFGSTAPSGVPLEFALATPAVRTLGLIDAGWSPQRALRAGGLFLDGMMRTFVADSSRQAASVDIASRPGVGYVRMLNPPSCDACTILAGRFYRWNKGFLRHPRCDCIHRPTGSLDAAKSEGLIDDPYEYFNGLSGAEQDRVFGAQKAQAIRDGADIYRVQNSWRGRDGLYTAEGTSRGGFASALRGRRLTPEAIYRISGDNKARALALLRENGYLIGPQVGGGIVRGNIEGFGALGRGGTRVGASRAVEQARLTGVRDPNVRATMTEAERRVFDARARYETALAGRNPFGNRPVTPLDLARAETEYRRWLASGGQIYPS